MRLARSNVRPHEAPRFSKCSFLPPRAPDAQRPRQKDPNDSGGIWQVVFRQNEPVDSAAAGPWLPVAETQPDRIPRQSQKKATEDACLVASILPMGDFGEYRRPEGVRKCQLPWDGIWEETCERSGVRRHGRARSSNATAYGRLQGARRRSTPRGGHGVVVRDAGGSQLSWTGEFRPQDLRYLKAASPSPDPPASARERHGRMSETSSVHVGDRQPALEMNAQMLSR
eukprot:TRINITY_DN42692_c0_g1_i1.p1 TRINITY_DN42692_c0_g1~~TRINITY_DN42692_c0_g1_i1.p1  ORF type:complete len:227 (+),score=18.67 TRINITY_DN42692_c0_g1_i1:76-756(+)